jgi:hypothetical protein
MLAVPSETTSDGDALYIPSQIDPKQAEAGVFSSIRIVTCVTY